MFGFGKNKVEPENKPIQEVWNHQGHTFRVLNPITMAKERQKALTVIDFKYSLGFAPETGKKFADRGYEVCSAPEKFKDKDDLIKQLQDKLRDAGRLFDIFGGLITQDFKTAPYLLASSTFILIDDEPEHKILPEYMSLKANLCQNDSEVNLFFLRVANIFAKNMTDSTDIIKLWEFYPNQVEVHLEQIFYKEIASTIYSDMERIGTDLSLSSQQS